MPEGRFIEVTTYELFLCWGAVRHPRGRGRRHQVGSVAQ